MEKPKKLKYCAGGKWTESKTDRYMDCYNPSTGCVTNTWFSEEEEDQKTVDTWDGTMVSMQDR